jgi:DNA-binding response OmpR family regulator/HD-like signal output (HDOD) protein
MTNGYRALIVDDEVAMQRLGSHALRQQGFQCECASDGEEAEQMLKRSHFDAVVTELTLPHKNGYALLLELLKAESRPIIVVYTNVIDARLTKDLLMRGVDDILPKPVHGAFLAGRIRALVDRRAAHKEASRSPVASSPPEEAESPSPSTDEREGLPISLTQLNRKLAKITTVLPVSNAALDVFDMTRSCEWEISQIAAAVQRDASLTADVLKLANCHLYNPSGQRIIQLDQAVMRIGQNRVGELALAASALARLAPEILPWLDLELTWKRSMAAGLVMESLVEAGCHQAIEEGLLLSAMMYPLGRVALGMLFPKEYQEMVARCEQTGEALQEQERRALPTSHVQVMAHLLASWNISPDVFLPLKFALDEYSSLVRLAEPLRTKTELVKVAIVLGRLAAGSWQSWDLVQLPTAALLKRLRISDPMKIVAQAASDLDKLAEFSLRGNAELPNGEPLKALQPVAYCDLTAANHDLLLALLPSLGLEPQPCAAEALGDLTEPSLVNCLSVPARRLASQRIGANTIIVTDQEKRQTFSRLATAIALPMSYGRLKEGLDKQLRDIRLNGAAERTPWAGQFSRRLHVGVAKAAHEPIQ